MNTEGVCAAIAAIMHAVRRAKCIGTAQIGGASTPTCAGPFWRCRLGYDALPVSFGFASDAQFDQQLRVSGGSDV
jgi:hypothetical protein